jgi:hypothetical protein
MLRRKILKRPTPPTKVSASEGHFEIYMDLEDSETNPLHSGLQDAISGNKELRDKVPEGETSSKSPRALP